MTTLAAINTFISKACNSRKYSNYTLFNRRETEYSSHIKQKNISNNISSIKRPYSTSFKKISFSAITKKKNNNSKTKSVIPSIFSANQSTIYSKNSSKSTGKRRIYIDDYFHKKNKSKINQANIMESILNLEKYYTPNASFNSKYLKTIPNINPNINMNKYFNDLNYINQIYLTEANIKKPIIKKEKEKKTNFNYYNFDDYNENIYNDFSKNQNADILTKFLKEKTNYDYGEILKTEYNLKTINHKRKRINLCKEKRDEFMAKTRSEKYDKLALNSKKELYIRINEIYQNKLEYVDDRIGSFETWKTLNHDFFDNKIGDYLKFLMYKKAYEKNKVEDLLEEIIKIKKESNKIYSKMAKIEVEKNKILRWVYFQIKIKEKKIILPNYYKLILENINVIDDYLEKIKIKKEKNLEFRESTSSIIHSPSPKKRDRQKKSMRKKNTSSSIGKENTSSNINLNLELISFLNKKEGKEEYFRIKEYKNNLIYKNVEEFNDALLLMEKEDLRLIEYHDFIQAKIYEFKKELEKAKKEKINMNNIFQYNQNLKLNELNQLKNRYFAMEAIIKSLQDNKNITKKTNEKIKKRNKSANIISKSSKNYRKILLNKINNLFNLCKLVKFKNKKDYEILDEKRKLLKNNEILYYFVYIEYSVNYLLGEVEKFKESHKDGEKAIKKIFFEVERGHRIEKTEELRRQLREKYIKLENKVNKRNNKIYLLPYRKVSDVFKLKKEKIVVKDVGDTQPKFEDFIDDDYNNYDDYNNIEEKN